MRSIALLPALLPSLLIVGCATPGGTDSPDAMSQSDGGNLPPDAPPVDACPPSLFGTFAMPLLEARSNVCVPSATCTFAKTAVGTCSAHVTCQYELAGTQSGDVDFVSTPDGWAASLDVNGRRHDWIHPVGGSMSYRTTGNVTDHHSCIFTDGATAPVFRKPATGACPDLTRTFKLREATAHSCSHTLRCGVIQSAGDACVADLWCTFPTGGSVEAANVTIARAGGSGVIVGDTTRDPMYPERYELHLTGDFSAGTGGATGVRTEYYFNAPATPSCSWLPNGPF